MSWHTIYCFRINQRFDLAISSLFEIHFRIRTTDKINRRFDFTEIIFKFINVIKFFAYMSNMLRRYLLLKAIKNKTYYVYNIKI